MEAGFSYIFVRKLTLKLSHVLYGLLLGLAEALKKRSLLALQATVEAAASTAMNKLGELNDEPRVFQKKIQNLVVSHVQQLIQLNSTVRELLEGSLLLLGILHPKGVRHIGPPF